MSRDFALAGAIDPEQLSLEPVTDWIPVEIMVDSGASESVCPATAFPGYAVMQTDASVSGMTYKAAGGMDIPNLGVTQPVLSMPNGDLNCMTFQVAPVSTILAAVSRITSHRCKVVFDEPHIGSHIENKTTGRHIPLYQTNGVYLLKAWLKPTAPVPKNAVINSSHIGSLAPFQWPGR